MRPRSGRRMTAPKARSKENESLRQGRSEILPVYVLKLQTTSELEYFSKILSNKMKMVHTRD